MQFVVLQIEYHGESRLQWGGWLNGNLRGAMLRLIEEHDKRPGSKIYFATVPKRQRPDLGLKNRCLSSVLAVLCGEEEAVETAGRYRLHGTERGYPDEYTRAASCWTTLKKLNSRAVRRVGLNQHTPSFRERIARRP